MQLSYIDNHGIKEYKIWVKLVVTFVVLYTYLALMAYGLVYVESFSQSSNIREYKDAFWCLRLASNTIGYGDFYPVTELGRSIITLTFYIGAGIVGVIVGIISGVVNKFDSSIQNRELRNQNAEIIQLLKQSKDT